MLAMASLVPPNQVASVTNEHGRDIEDLKNEVAEIGRDSDAVSKQMDEMRDIALSTAVARELDEQTHKREINL